MYLELQLKDTESKLLDLFSELNGFKFVATLVLKFKKIQSDDKTLYRNNSRLLFTDTDNLVYEIKTEDVYEDFSIVKKCFILVIIRLSQNTTMIQTVGKMKDETGGFAIEEFIGLKSKMYSFLVVDNREHEELNDVNKNVAALKKTLKEREKKN